MVKLCSPLCYWVNIGKLEKKKKGPRKKDEENTGEQLKPAAKPNQAKTANCPLVLQVVAQLLPSPGHALKRGLWDL